MQLRKKTTPVTLAKKPHQPLKLNSARAFHWANSLGMVETHGGVNWARVDGDWSLVVMFANGNRIVRISPLLMCTRDRNYFKQYFSKICANKSTENLIWHMDTYDKEFSKQLKERSNG